MELDIIIADDQTLYRKALVSLLGNCNGYKITAEAADGDELLKILSSKSPNLILIDLAMPKASGYEILKLLKKRNQNIKTLVISACSDDAFIGKSIEEGANGYLHKSVDSDEIIRAVHSIAENGFYFNTKTNFAMMNRLAMRKKERPSFNPLNIRLAERELTMIQLFSEGLSNSEIGEKLFISPRTVETVRQQMIRKTDTKNITGLVLFAVKNGLISI